MTPVVPPPPLGPLMVMPEFPPIESELLAVGDPVKVSPPITAQVMVELPARASVAVTPGPGINTIGLLDDEPAHVTALVIV